MSFTTFPIPSAELSTVATDARTAINAMANTNAAVNAAIATDPLASRNSLDAQQRITRYRGLENSVNVDVLAGDGAVSMVCLGDSFAAVGSLFDFNLASKVNGGYRCNIITGGGDSGVTDVADFTKSPNGNLKRIAAGGNLTCGYLNTGANALVNKAHYTIFTGTGTAQLQYREGAGSWVNLGSAIDTTAITKVSVQTVSLPFTGFYSLRLKSLTVAEGAAVGKEGNVDGWIGISLDGPGLTIIDFATTGNGIEQASDIDEDIWKAMIAGYKTSGGSQIVITGYSDPRFTEGPTTSFPTTGTPRWDASGPAQILFDWSREQNSTVDWLVVGPHQVDTARTDPPNALLDAAFTAIGIGSNSNERQLDGSVAQQEFAIRNNIAFVDCTDFTNYAEGNAAGLYGDQIHLTAKGQNLKRSLIYERTNLGWLVGNTQRYTSLRFGNVKLSPAVNRSGIFSLKATTGNSDNVAWLGKSFKCGLSTRPETDGIEFTATDAYTAHIGNYGQAGSNAARLTIGYSGAGMTIRSETTAGSSLGTSAKPWEQLFVDKTITAAATTGAQTINKCSGSVNFAAAATSLVVTSNKVTANSVIIATVATNDSTMSHVQAVPAAGSFTLYANAAPTAETRVNWFVVN